MDPYRKADKVIGGAGYGKGSGVGDGQGDGKGNGKGDGKGDGNGDDKGDGNGGGNGDGNGGGNGDGNGNPDEVKEPRLIIDPLSIGVIAGLKQWGDSSLAYGVFGFILKQTEYVCFELNPYTVIKHSSDPNGGKDNNGGQIGGDGDGGGNGKGGGDDNGKGKGGNGNGDGGGGKGNGDGGGNGIGGDGNGGLNGKGLGNGKGVKRGGMPPPIVSYTGNFEQKMNADREQNPRLTMIEHKMPNAGPMNNEHMGDTYHGLVIGVLYAAMDMCCGREMSALGIRGIIDVLAEDNPYGAAKVFNDLDDTTKQGLKHHSDRIPPKDKTLGERGYCYYQIHPDGLKPASSFYRDSEVYEEYHIEIDANVDNLIFDQADEFIEECCEDIELEAVTSFKFHTNSWGLGACNWFAENIVAKMKNLQKIDFSDTINFKHRTDLPLSCGNILDQAADKNILRINF